MGVRQLSPGDRRAGPRPGPTLRTEDGVALATTCWLADTPSPATVVICHGFTANKADPKVVALAELLCAGGHEVITYDARGTETPVGPAPWASSRAWTWQPWWSGRPPGAIRWC